MFMSVLDDPYYGYEKLNKLHRLALQNLEKIKSFHYVTLQTNSEQSLNNSTFLSYDIFQLISAHSTEEKAKTNIFKII